MLIEKDIKKLFQQLLQEEIVHINVDNSDVTVRIFDNASQFSLSTMVYSGENFIPKSVRSCMSHKLPNINGHVQTFLTIDEQKFQIHLNYQGKTENFQHASFRNLLEDFSFLSDEWRLYLDENDKNDLIHVRIPR